MPTLRALIDDGRVHVVDGAMGTMLYQKGVFLNVCFDELAVRQPAIVAEVHAAYAQAGAELVETNTFGANPVKLAHYGLAADTEQLNCAAATVARRAAGDDVAVLGAIGPLGVRLEPFGELGHDEAEAAFGRQVDGLLEGGVDGFCLETFSDVEELTVAIRAVRARCDLAVMAQMTVGLDGAHGLRHHAGSLRPRPRCSGRRCHRRQLLDRSAGGARSDRAARSRGAVAAVGAAQRRPAARGGRPQDLHGEPRVHGRVRPTDGRGRREVRRGLLWHHARAHQGDPFLRPQRHAGTTCCRAARRRPPRRVSIRCRCRSVRRSAPSSRRGVCHHRGDRPATRRRSVGDAVAGARAQGRRRRRGQPSRRAARAEPDGRPPLGHR